MWLALFAAFLLVGPIEGPEGDSPEKSEFRPLIDLLDQSIADTKSEQKPLLVFSKLQLCEMERHELRFKSDRQQLSKAETEKVSDQLKKVADEITKARSTLQEASKSLSPQGKKELQALMDEHIKVLNGLIARADERGYTPEETDSFREILQRTVKLRKTP